MNRTEAIARVRSTVDDIESVRFTDAEIEQALYEAQKTVWLQLATSGANIMNQQTTLTTASDGTLSLSGIKPLIIVAIHEQLINILRPVAPLRPQDHALELQGSYILNITYVPRVAYPATLGDSFVWGVLPDPEPLDTLMCLVAAEQIKLKEGEEIPGLDKRIDRAEKSVRATVAVPSWGVMRDPRRFADEGYRIRYRVTGLDSIQVCI